MHEVIEPEIIGMDRPAGEASPLPPTRGRGIMSTLLYGVLLDISNLIPLATPRLIGGAVIAALACFHLRVGIRRWPWWMAMGAVYCGLSGPIRFLPLCFIFMLVLIIAPKVKNPFKKAKE